MGLQHAGSLNSMGEAVSQELVLTAASEMTVHMARAVASGSKRPERAAHAAARRMVRTMVSGGGGSQAAREPRSACMPAKAQWNTGGAQAGAKRSSEE